MISATKFGALKRMNQEWCQNEVLPVVLPIPEERARKSAMNDEEWSEKAGKSAMNEVELSPIVTDSSYDALKQKNSGNAEDN